MVEWKGFLTKPKHQCHSSQRGEWVYGARSWKESRLLCESVFVPISKQILILKMVERRAFILKPKHQCHSSQWREWVCGAQFWKERGLLCDRMFPPIGK